MMANWGVGVGFGHIAPSVLEGESENGVGKVGELVAQGFDCP